MGEHATRPSILILGPGFWSRNWCDAIARSSDCDFIGIAGGQTGFHGLGIDGVGQVHEGLRVAIARSDAVAAMTVLPTALHVEAVGNGSETLTDTEDTFHDFALVMAALESARSGQAEIVAR